MGWPVLVFCFGLVLTLVLFIRRVPGAILIGIIAATVLAVVIDKVVKVDPKSWGAVEPKLPDSFVASPDFGLMFKVDLFGGFGRAGVVTATVVLFTLLLSGFFDAMGTILGVCEEAGMTDENGRLPGLSRILTVDGFGAIIGGGVNGSANTAVVESAAASPRAPAPGSPASSPGCASPH